MLGAETRAAGVRGSTPNPSLRRNLIYVQVIQIHGSTADQAPLLIDNFSGQYWVILFSIVVIHT